MFKKKPPPAPSLAVLIGTHQRLAESHLRRSGKAGRLEAEIRHATMASAHASLAISYQLQQGQGTLPSPTTDIVSGDDELVGDPGAGSDLGAAEEADETETDPPWGAPSPP